jgi:Ni/Fe-hydrogenase subunit HybB-like protein
MDVTQWILQFLVSLAWIAFLSWLVGRFAYRQMPPVARAAWTAATSFAIASILSLVLQFGYLQSSLATELGLARFSMAPFLFYGLAAFADFLLLKRAFGRVWVDDGEVFR